MKSSGIKKMVEKLNAELDSFAKLAEEDGAILYEDPFTSFGLRNVSLNGLILSYEYSFNECTGRKWTNETDECFDEDEVKDTLKFWQACLKRAKRYWSMDTDTLDAIQNGDANDDDDTNQ